MELLAIGGGYGRGQALKQPSGIWYDSRREEIYVADRGNHKLAVFGKDGYLLRSFTHWVTSKDPQGRVVAREGEPKGLAVNSRGDIYVIDDLDDAVDVLDYRGRSLRRLRAADLVDTGDETLTARDTVTPAAVAVDEEDRVYIATTGARCQIVVLTADGKVLRRLGHRGRERGGFQAITGLTVDRQGRLLVTDAQALPVQVLSPEGEPVLAFGEHAVGPQNFSLPSGAVRDRAGGIWVADAIRQVVTHFDARGKYLGLIGGLGTGPGDMYAPVALAGDGDRLLIVLEKNGARFQVFRVAS